MESAFLEGGQQVESHGGVRYLGVYKSRGQGLRVRRQQQWEGVAGKVGRGQIDHAEPQRSDEVKID